MTTETISDLNARICDICEESKDILDGGWIKVEEGGDIPPYTICAECLFDPSFADRLDDARDMAELGEGHDCWLNARQVRSQGMRGDHEVTACQMCNVILQ